MGIGEGAFSKVVALGPGYGQAGHTQVGTGA
jgi:hypothetical protein